MPKHNPKHNKKQNLKRNIKKRNLIKNLKQLPQKNVMKSCNPKRNNNFQVINDYGMSIDGFDNKNLNQIELLKDILLGRLQSEDISKNHSNQNWGVINNDNDILEENTDPLIFQLKISINGAKPPIWRRILIWNYATFDELHELIQEYFDWDDMHLHEFRIVIQDYFKRELTIGSSYNNQDLYSKFDYDEDVTELYKFLSLEQSKVHYTYDFGDNWGVLIKLEKIFTKDELESYEFIDDLPVCIKGKKAGPPEDCGGIWGYSDILEALKNPDDPESGELLEWVGEDFDPAEITHEIISVKLPKKIPHIKNKIKINNHIQSISSTNLNLLNNTDAILESNINNILQSVLEEGIDTFSEDELVAFNYSSIINHLHGLKKKELTEWKKLMNISIAFRDLAPWNWMYDNHIFGVKDPLTDKIMFCSIMGNFGEHLALAIFEGKNGLNSYIKIADLNNYPMFERETEFDPIYALLEQKCLKVSFESFENIDEKDMKLVNVLNAEGMIKNYSKKSKLKGKIWPKFETYDPFFLPTLINRNQVRKLTIVLEQVLKITNRFKKDPHLISRWTGKKHTFLLCEQDIDKKNNKPIWKDSSYTYKPKSQKLPLLTEYNLGNIPQLTQFEPKIKQLMKKSHQKEGIWEIGDYLEWNFIQNKDERPYLPLVMLCVDKETQLLTTFCMGQNDSDNSQYYDSLLESFKSLKIVPTEIQCVTIQMYNFLTPLCKKLEINLKQKTRLDVLEEVVFNSPFGTILNVNLIPLFKRNNQEIKPTMKEKDRKRKINAIKLNCNTKAKKIKSSLFYSCEEEKILFNWYLFEIARTIEEGFLMFIDLMGRVKGFRKDEITKNTLKIIKEKMDDILQMSHNSSFIIPKKQLKRLFPLMSNDNLEELFFSLECTLNGFYSMCKNCPTACLDHKDIACTMFDDPLYSSLNSFQK